MMPLPPEIKKKDQALYQYNLTLYCNCSWAVLVL